MLIRRKAILIRRKAMLIRRKAILILASSSIARKKILEKLGLKFKVITANLDEEKFTATNPIRLVKKIAKAKAFAVLQKLNPKRISPQDASFAYPLNALIIAADSMIVFEEKTYGKPKTKEQAKEFLQMLSGKTHEFITGLCITNTKTNKIYQTSGKSKVIFAKLTAEEINEYVKVASVTSFAGAYSLEEKGNEIIRPKVTIIGSESNVIGIPLEKLIPILRKEGFRIQKSLQE